MVEKQPFIYFNLHSVWVAFINLQQAVRVATRYPPPLSYPRGRPSASRAAEQTQRNSSFPRPIHSHGHRCTPHALKPSRVKRPGDLDL